jgi:hypothetical protein
MDETGEVLMKKPHSIRPQDKPQTKLRIANRRARLMTLFAQGLSKRKAAKILRAEGYQGCSDANVGFDLQALSREAPIKVEEAREQAENKLKALETFVMESDQLGDGETVSSLLAIHDRIARLLGLDAPSKSVSASVTANLTPEYLEIAKAMADVLPEDRPKVLDYARSLARPLELTADCFPPRRTK